MNKLWVLVASFLTCSALLATDWGKMPDWAEASLQKVNFEQIPDDAEVWTLLDDLEFRMQANGKLRVHRRLLRYVVSESGSESGSVYLVFGNEDDTRVKSIKGWHQSRNGKFDKLNKRDVVTVGNSDSSALTRDTTTLAFFQDVARGSVVAFESVEIQDSFFPMRFFKVLKDDPVRMMKIRARSDDAGMKSIIRIHGFEHWSLDFQEQPDQLILTGLPATRAENYTPDFIEAYPYVQVTFVGQRVNYLGSWDEMAKWYVGVFRQGAGIKTPSKPAKSLDAVTTMVTNVSERISYRQRYLSPGRGWVPAAGPDVARRAYGDCKDMVASMAFEGSLNQMLVYPVMANIGNGFRAMAESKPGPIFNHLIAAVALEKSMGLPAEITLNDRVFLLVDPTSSHTPFGYMPDYYRDRKVMVCLDEGAHWLTVPEKALEQAQITIELSGTLDNLFSLKGSLTIVEQGNAYGLRTVFRENNPLDLESFLRRQLDLPGFMDMTAVAAEELDDGDIKFIYQVRWPSFLMRDAGGLRLPYAIVQPPLKGLSRQDHSRQMPIFLAEMPKTYWKIQLRCQTPVSPGETGVSWKDDFRQFVWKAKGGDLLQIQYRSQAKQLFFAKNEIEAGVASWKAYRKAFNPFALSGASLSVTDE